MIILKTKICLIFSFLKLLITSNAVDIINDGTTSSSTTSTTAALKAEDDAIYACDVCTCWKDDYLNCESYSKPLKSLNIKIDNSSSFYQINKFKNAEIKVETDVIKKDKILHGFEERIENLDFRDSKIGSIEDGAFDKFVKLHTLNFRRCNISLINNGIFTKAVGRTLRTLELNHRGFVKLEPSAFKYLTNLTHLDLGVNEMDAFLSKGMFPASLIELNLQFCGISNLHEQIFENLINLQTLKLTGNPLTTIPIAIASLISLNNLKLDYTKITVLTFGGIKALGNLTELDLSNIESLEFIDSFAFCSFPNLKTLDLSNNRKLKSIHENAFGSFIGHFVTKLQELKIDNCNITVLPENLLQWEKIKAVSISQNPFVCNCSMAWLINDFINPKPKYYKSFRGELPRCHSPSELEGQTFQEISGTVCFETNSITDNRIVVCDGNEKYGIYRKNGKYERYGRYDTDLPCKCDKHELSCKSHSYSFDNPPFLSLNLKIKDDNYTLKKVVFSGYKFYTLKKGQILRGQEKNLEEIELIVNGIEKIENGTFDDFISLKILRIIGNEIKILDENVLTEAVGKTLIELELDDYDSINITYTAFKYLKKLEKLTLFWTDIMSPMKKELFPSSLKNLKSLTLKTFFITALDDNLFDNLVNLEELYLTLGSFTSVPIALNALSNLQLLDISATNIPVFDTQNLTTVFTKLKTLKMEYMRELTAIENCAFCLFPNLEDLSLAFSSSLESIHENAFGNSDLNSTTNMTEIKTFDVQFCKLSTLSENLLRWDTVTEIKINGNPFICNCSMAWLINDFAKLCPIYYHPSNAKCAGPIELKGKSFYQISSNNCSTNFTLNANFEDPENCTLKYKSSQNEASETTDHSLHITLFVIIGAITVIIIGAVVFYFYRRRKIAFANFQEEIDKLNVDMSMSTL